MTKIESARAEVALDPSRTDTALAALVGCSVALVRYARRMPVPKLAGRPRKKRCVACVGSVRRCPRCING
jgi:hypothetical protein